MGQGPGLSLAASVPNVANDAVACGTAETFGFLGFLAVYGLLGLLAMNGFRIARAAATPYQFLLAFGLTLAQSLQALIVTAGILGLIPLTGVSTPLLSTGRTGTLVAFATVGVLASVSARARSGEAAAPFHAPAGHLTAALAAGLALIFVAGGCYALVHPADTSLRIARTRTHRLNPAAEEPELQEVRNPRLTAMARLLRRGSIYSSDGVAVATSSFGEAQAQAPRVSELFGDSPRLIHPSDRRHYPLGNLLVYLVGDLRYPQLTQDERQIENRFDVLLRGWENEAKLLPLLYSRFERDNPQVHALHLRPHFLQPPAVPTPDVEDSPRRPVTPQRRRIAAWLPSKLRAHRHSTRCTRLAVTARAIIRQANLVGN
jgi:hypothetical protein